MMTVQPSTVAAIEGAPEFAALAAEYADETLIAGMPPPAARWATYHALETAGLLSVFAARISHGGELIGFISVLAAILPRYGEPVAMCESFFVARAHRKTGAGLRLLKAAEQKARAIGSRGLVVSTPFGGDLFKVLPRLGYDECARVFFKKVTPDG
jgi:GNAT superfamily N-acetyltransferase